MALIARVDEKVFLCHLLIIITQDQIREQVTCPLCQELVDFAMEIVEAGKFASYLVLQTLVLAGA